MQQMKNQQSHSKAFKLDYHKDNTNYRKNKFNMDLRAMLEPALLPGHFSKPINMVYSDGKPLDMTHGVLLCSLPLHPLYINANVDKYIEMISSNTITNIVEQLDTIGKDETIELLVKEINIVMEELYYGYIQRIVPCI